MKSKQGSMVYYIYGFKWHKSRANFRQRWNFKISPHRRHKSFHCIRWCCVTRHGQIWQWYTQSEQFADKIAIRKNSRFERSFLLACLISPTKRSLPSSRPTPRIYEKKKKKKIIAESAMQTRTRAYFHVVRGNIGICSIPDARHIFFHPSLSTFEIYFPFHKVEKKSISWRMFTRFVDIRLRTIVLTSNFTTSLNISNLRPFFPPLFPFIYLIFRNRKSHAFTSRQYFLLLLILTLIIFTSLSIRRRIDILSIFFPACQDQFLISAVAEHEAVLANIEHESEHVTSTFDFCSNCQIASKPGMVCCQISWIVCLCVCVSVRVYEVCGLLRAGEK